VSSYCRPPVLFRPKHCSWAADAKVRRILCPADRWPFTPREQVP